jgi:hypothetical protein
MTDISEKGSNFVRDLGDAARKNPLSAALIGMGVIWLFTGNRPVERAGNLVRRTGLDRLPDAAGNALDAARSAVRSGADALGDGVASTTDTIRETGADVFNNAARRGRDYADTASEHLSSLPETGALAPGNRRGGFRYVPLQFKRSVRIAASGTGSDRARHRCRDCGCSSTERS